jgi:hypothetical protein
LVTCKQKAKSGCKNYIIVDFIIGFLFRDLYASEENQLTKSELLHDKYVSKLKQEAENNAHLRR